MKRRGLFGLVLLVSTPLLLAQGDSQDGQGKDGKESQERKDGEDPSKESGAEGEPEAPGESKPLTIDEQYVRERLEALLSPATLEYLPNGRVRLEFDFTEKSGKHDIVFTPNIVGRLDSSFRWTVEREELWRNFKDGSRVAELAGIKMADSGVAFLNCWFRDEVQAEVEYSQLVTFSKAQLVAVVFGPEKSKLIGSNFGSECVNLAKGKPKGPRGTVEPVNYRNLTRLKLVVRAGEFEAHREGRQRQKSTYPRKDYESGRVGLLWSGSVAGIIKRLEVVGLLDYKRMAQEMRKAGGK